MKPDQLIQGRQVLAAFAREAEQKSFADRELLGTVCYWLGRDDLLRNEDPETAEYYFLKAANCGHEAAFLDLGDVYAIDLEDHEQALEWLTIAANHNYSAANQHKKGEALNALGQFYKFNHQDFQQAEAHYLLAVEAGSEIAIRNLGDLYADDLHDRSKAIHWLTKAIEHPYPKGKLHHKAEALNSLAMFYLDILQDRTQADHYFALAEQEETLHPLRPLNEPDEAEAAQQAAILRNLLDRVKVVAG